MQIYFYIIGIQENKDKISKIEKKRQENRLYYQRHKHKMRGNNKKSLLYN